MSLPDQNLPNERDQQNRDFIFFLISSLQPLVWKQEAFLSPFFFFFLIDFYAGKEVVLFFYAYCDSDLYTPESDWLCIINWRWPKKKTQQQISCSFLGVEKTYAQKTCLFVHQQLILFAKELHVHFCFVKSTLCVLVTGGGTSAPKCCQVSSSIAEILLSLSSPSFSFSFSSLFPLLCSLSHPICTSPSFFSSLPYPGTLPIIFLLQALQELCFGLPLPGRGRSRKCN